MENMLRLAIALSVFLLMIGWEWFLPKRIEPQRKKRWPVNLGLAIFNMAVMRLTIGGLAYLSAINAMQQGWGAFNLIHMPDGLHFGLSLLLLDFAIYLQHIISHKWAWLWRLHQVHHSDTGFDATTAVRFHPLEIMLSMFYKVAWVYALGADPMAVIVFEIILNAAATFNHGNVVIPRKLDKYLQWVLVTPDMHRIHHSTRRQEMDSNYGFSISIWDRLCRTYTPQAAEDQRHMAIGLPRLRSDNDLRFWTMLKLPFAR